MYGSIKQISRYYQFINISKSTHFNLEKVLVVQPNSPVTMKNRKIQVKLFRLRLWYVGVNQHLNRFNMNESNLCETCNTSDTIEHYMCNRVA